MTQNQNDHDAFLNAFFDAEKSKKPDVSEHLMSAILDDAKVVQNQCEPVMALSNTQPGILEQLSNMFGGWRVATAFATCVCMGIGLGYASTISETITNDYVAAGEEDFQLGLSGLFDVAEL